MFDFVPLSEKRSKKRRSLRVVYVNGKYDIVLSDTLHRLITQNKVRAFYRFLEKKWAVVGQMAIRA